MTGKIIKGIAGFYYVVAESGIYECKAKGIFRKEKKKPLVGDNVEIEVLDSGEMTGNIYQILPRKNELIRPAVANADQAMVIFALESPKPNIGLLDRFLLMMELQHVPAVICFNKEDLVCKDQAAELEKIYLGCGYDVLFCSAKQNEGIDEIRKKLQGKTTVVSGPSGVGKSSITNLLQKNVLMETGEISKKLKRGKNTTRHSQLILVDNDTFIMDTPGFSSLDLIDVSDEKLRFYFPEFEPYEGRCRFNGCVHVHEPGCQVKKDVSAGVLSASRYDNYVSFYNEQKEREKRRY